MTLVFTRHIPDDVQELLRDAKALRKVLLEYPSQDKVAKTLRVSSDTIKRAREYHGFPSRPQKMSIPPDLSAYSPAEVLATPELTMHLMVRAYTRVGVCMPWCHYWDNENVCPRAAAAAEERELDEELGNGIPDGCPVAFYWGSERGETPLFLAITKARPSGNGNGQRGAVKRKPEKSPNEPETPESFRQFLKEVTEL